MEYDGYEQHDDGYELMEAKSDGYAPFDGYEGFSLLAKANLDRS